MRSIFRFVLLTGPFLFTATAPAQISMVHATSCGSVALPGSCTIPSTGSNNLLVVGWQGYYGSTVTINSMTDNAGNMYLEAGATQATRAAGSSSIDIWYSPNVSAGTTSITITPSVSGARNDVVIWEFSGIAQAAPVDATATLSNQPSSTAPTTSPSITTAAAREVAVALVEVSGGVNGIASGNPFTNDDILSGNGFAHLITSQAGTYQAQWSQGGAYESTIASFRGAVTTGGACDVNQDGVVNILDIQIAADMYLGLMPCSFGTAGCTATVANQIASAALGSNCAVTASQGSGGGTISHSVSLSWMASTTQNVNYNVYRGTKAGGPYSTKVASSLTITSFTDTTVQSGQTAYVANTAVNSAGESGYSNQAQAIIPTP